MIIPTNTPIDRITGGLPRGRISLIYGPTGCGKTTLAVVASRAFLEKGFHVVYIDTEEGLLREVGQEIEVKYAYSLREQKEILKELAKSGLKDVAVIVDTLTGHFHREVLKAPAQFRAGVAGDLSGKLIDQISILRQIVGQEKGIGLVTAHLRSPVSDAFRLNVLRKMAKAYKDGKYIPTATDYERYMAYDPVRWIGGQGLGMHCQFRFRMYVDEDKSRIIEVEKWPMVPNWCIRYVVLPETGEFKVIGDKFIMDSQTRSRLLALEFKTLLGEVEVLEKEGIEVEEAEKQEKVVEEKKKPKKPRSTDIKFPKIPSLGEIAEEERVRGGADGGSSDIDAREEGSGCRQE